MKKKILIILSLALFILPNRIIAASGVSVNASSNRVYVGETVTISVTVSSDVKIGGLNYNVYFDDAKIKNTGYDSTFPQGVAEGYTTGPTSVTNTWTFIANEAGTVTFSTSDIEAYSLDEDNLTFSSASTTIEIVNPSRPSNGGGSNNGGTNGGSNGGQNEYKYSDDNNLSSLIIEGFDIEFDSNVTEYSVSVPNETKKVKIGATANNGKASVSGIGDYDVKEGNNEIKIVVTAENGDAKTYKVNVVVKELSPIEVKVNDKTYNVVRKSDKLPKANTTYKSSNILIKGENVPCYHSEITDIYLIGLMDEKGKVELFNYDSKNDKFSAYNEINISGLYISLIENNDAPIGYKKQTIKIGEKEYDAFAKEGAYPLLYGVNLETGEKNFYSYDSSENTLQKYMQTNGINSKCYLYAIYGLIGLSVFEFIMLIGTVISKNKKIKKASKETINEEVEETSYDDEKNITDDLTDEYTQTESTTENEEIDEPSEPQQEESNEWESSSDNYKEFSEDTLGHTALISRSVSNVYNNTKNRKESIKERKALRKKKKKNKDDDDMFKF